MARLEKTTRISEDELIAFGTGKLCLAAQEGDVQNGSVMAGQVSGLISDILPVAELLEQIMAQAQEQIAVLNRFCAQKE